MRQHLAIVPLIFAATGYGACDTDRLSTDEGTRPESPAQAAHEPTTNPPDSDLSRPAPDPRWESLFTRTSGWTGADGAATIPLPGRRSLWLFGDSWIGPIIDGRPAPGSAMVNNTIAVHAHGGNAAIPPATDAIEFLWSAADPERPAAWAVPAQPNEWFWPFGGGLVAPNPEGGPDRLLLFFTRIARRDDSNSIWNFAARGSSLIIIPNPHDPPARWNQQQHTLTTLQPGGREIIWGAAALPDPASSSLLIYGIDSTKSLNRTLLLARAPAATIHRFDTWSFRAGDDWSPDLSRATPVTTNVAPELSIHRLGERYLMIYSQPPLGAGILARTAPAPEGPWSEPVDVYTCPEPAEDRRRFTYAAKAHPELSARGELLISYCVNSTDFADIVAHADAYRPRFIRVPRSMLPPPPEPRAR